MKKGNVKGIIDKIAILKFLFLILRYTKGRVIIAIKTANKTGEETFGKIFKKSAGKNKLPIKSQIDKKIGG